MIKYNFAGIETLASELDGNFKRLEVLAETLRSKVNSLDAAWNSEEASGAYLTAQQRWDTNFADSRTLLTNLSTKVREAGETMKGADVRTANFFR